MKLFASFLCLSLIIGVTGCSILNPNGQPVDQFITTNSATITATLDLTTVAAIKNLPAAQRVSVARYAYAVALGIQSAAQKGTVDPNALDQLTQALLSGVGPAYQAPVGVIVSSIEGVALAKINAALSSASSDVQARAFVALALAASQGVEEGASTFTAGTSTPLMGAKADHVGVIDIPALSWK